MNHLTKTYRKCCRGHRYRDGEICCGWHRKECKAVRKEQARALRIANKERIRQGREPEAPLKTRGWLTW